MLRSAGVRSKILAVLVLPLLLLGMATGLLATQQVQQARQAHEVEKIAAVSGPFAQLVRGIATERATTAAAVLGSTEATAALPGVRAEVDEGLAEARATVSGIHFSRLSPQAEQALGNVEQAHAELRLLRETVDRDGASVDTVMATFAEILREDLAMPGRVAGGVDDPQTADLLVGYGHLLTTRDLALREQEIGLRILAGAATATDTRALATLGDEQTEEVARWQFAVGSEAAEDAADLVGRQTQTVWSIARARVALASPATVARTGLTPELWTEITDARIDGLDQALAGIAVDVDTQAAAASGRAAALAALAAGAAVLGVGVTLLLSLVLSRRIVRPLRELTAAATSVREQLPRMVEQVRVPGAMPDVELPRIAVSGDDEVGRLAAAFNEVNDTVLQVAQEQAALRGSIAETFVNVARRNQVLLSRQLSFIDQLEQREEDPDTLENLFRLDHLATRMRRNAESLLVLANIEAGRRLRQPLALSDVIRTAASEIEQYERVSLALQVDPPTMGHLSLQLAHLLAELLENGTNFSEPHTPVLVSTTMTSSGVRVTVTDEGLGLTDEEMEAARAKISEVAADDVVSSQRLGFFVVGRLARRLGVTVSIARGTSKGLVVTVDLPPSLFVPGSVEVAAPAAPERPAASAAAAAAAHPSVPAQADVGTTPVPAVAADVERAAAEVPSVSSETPAAHVIRPTTAPPAGIEAASLLLPALAPDVSPTEVRVTGGGVSLPRRGRTAPAHAAAPSAAEVAASDAGATGRPLGDVAGRAGGATTVARAEHAGASAGEAVGLELPGAAHGRRAGLFGAFRARREVAESAAAAADAPTSLPAHDRGPAPLVVGPAPVHVPKQTVRPTGPTPQVPTEATAPPVLVEGAAAAEPPSTRETPDAEPVVTEPLTAGPHPTVPSGAAAEVVPVEPVAAQSLTTPVANPVDILPARGRRGRRSILGGGGRQAGSPTAAAAGQEAPPEQEEPGARFFADLAGGSPQGPASAAPPAPVVPAPAVAAPAVVAAAGAPHGDVGPGVPAQGSGPDPRWSGRETGGPPAGVPGARSVAPLAQRSAGASVREVPTFVDGEEIRQRSMLASEALSELSRLSSYSPASVGGRSGPTPLVRRQPAASEAAELPVPAGPAPEPRQRNAAEVRRMLSGFQSGVTRGRAGAEDGGRDSSSDPGTAAPLPVDVAGRGATASQPGSHTDHPMTDTSTTDTSTTD